MVKHGKAEKWAARSARLSAALRENLKRRKAQARERVVRSDLQGDLAPNPPPGERPVPGKAAPDTQVPDFRRNRGRD